VLVIQAVLNGLMIGGLWALLGLGKGFRNRETEGCPP
jgi:branched-subunit amino acid ABC-type transport system permease component